jgi:hypothetical protein
MTPIGAKDATRRFPHRFERAWVASIATGDSAIDAPVREEL